MKHFKSITSKSSTVNSSCTIFACLFLFSRVTGSLKSRLASNLILLPLPPGVVKLHVYTTLS